MNARTAITREEFDDGLAQLRRELVELKDALTPKPSRPEEAGTGTPLSESFVHKDEFRLFKWIGGLALASILGALGFIYQQIADLRVTVERQHAELRVDMNRQDAELLDVMNRQFAELRDTMNQQDAELRDTMNRQDAKLLDVMNRQFADLRERLVRVETLVGAGAQIGTDGTDRRNPSLPDTQPPGATDHRGHRRAATADRAGQPPMP